MQAWDERPTSLVGEAGEQIKGVRRQGVLECQPTRERRGGRAGSRAYTAALELPSEAAPSLPPTRICSRLCGARPLGTVAFARVCARSHLLPPTLIKRLTPHPMMPHPTLLNNIRKKEKRSLPNLTNQGCMHDIVSSLRLTPPRPQQGQASRRAARVCARSHLLPPTLIKRLTPARPQPPARSKAKKCSPLCALPSRRPSAAADGRRARNV